jgi:S1-C subfamily serine protease
MLVVLVVASCSQDLTTTPEQRAVTLSTDACGHASKTTGSGVIVGAEDVLTAAHVVVGASEVRVAVEVGPPVVATIVLLDTVLDLAVLRVPGVTATEVEFAAAVAGDELTIVDAASSGSVNAEVLRRVTMVVDEVRGTAKAPRSGYELLAEIDGGDSGAGVFAADDRLAGIVFAASTQRDGIAWVTHADELAAVLGQPGDAHYVCDPDASRVVLAG